MAEEDEENPGFITKSFASPYVSIPYAILSGLAAGATPGTARASRGINEGLSLGIGAEKYQTEQKKRQRLSESLNKLSSATTPVTSTKIGVDPERTTFSLPAVEGERLSDALPEHMFNAGERSLAPAAPLPNYQATVQKPLFDARQQQYLKAIGQDDPKTALTAMGSNLFKEPRAPHVFGSAETGYHALGDSGSVTPLVPGVPKSPTWRPYQVDLGDRIVTGAISSTGERRVDSDVPKGSAPAHRESPERAALIQAQTGLIPAQAAHLRAQTAQATAQAARIAEAAKILKDPTLSKEKLTTMRAGLLREKDMLEKGIDADTPENQQRVADIDTLLDDSRARLAAMIKKDNPMPGSKPPANDPKDPLGIRKK